MSSDNNDDIHGNFAVAADSITIKNLRSCCHGGRWEYQVELGMALSAIAEPDR